MPWQDWPPTISELVLVKCSYGYTYGSRGWLLGWEECWDPSLCPGQRVSVMSYWKRCCTEVLNLKRVMMHDALFDAGSEFTLMSSDLLKALHHATEVANKELKVQPCNMKVQLYSLVDTILSSVALIQISIVQMTLTHPVFSSDHGYIPLPSENIFLTGLCLCSVFKPWTCGHRYTMCPWTPWTPYH